MHVVVTHSWFGSVRSYDTSWIPLANFLAGFLTYCPHKGAIGHDHGPIDPTIEANYDILTNIFTEISKVFPGGWMHLGGDEVRQSSNIFI